VGLRTYYSAAQGERTNNPLCPSEKGKKQSAVVKTNQFLVMLPGTLLMTNAEFWLECVGWED